MAKLKHPAITPSQLEARSRLNESDFSAIGLRVSESLASAYSRLDGAAQRAAPCAAGAVPLPPPSNTGGKSKARPVMARLVLEDGTLKEVPGRRGWGGDAAFLDWLNFTVAEESFQIGNRLQVVTDDELIDHASMTLESIFGFGITSKREKGANFYRESWELGDGFGMFCHGGQRNTVLVMLSGTGLAAASDGWEVRLHNWLQSAVRPKLTRVDLAHDDFTGDTYSVDRADSDFDDGLFNCGGRNPSHEYRGNWKRPDGKGRTLYIGNRDNGKFCRVYEKGRQLGDKNHPWVRIEVEFKAVDRVIPFDVLLRPGEYLAASYPAFEWINARQERIVTTQKKTELDYAKALQTVKRQFGHYLHWIFSIEPDIETAISKITRSDKTPAFVPSFYDTAPPAIHHIHREQISSTAAVAMM